MTGEVKSAARVDRELTAVHPTVDAVQVDPQEIEALRELTRNRQHLGKG